jgi:hypothetical protein
MQKKKYLNQKNSYKKKQKFGRPGILGKVNKFKFDRKLSFFRKILKYKTYGRKSFNTVGGVNIFSHCLNIRVTSNNIFCLLRKRKNNAVVNRCSSGKYKIKTSKKKMKHTFELVLNSFFSEINRNSSSEGVVVSIISPIRIRKKLINLIFFNLKKKKLLIKVLKKKSFNGCRPPKKIRKKRRGIRILK